MDDLCGHYINSNCLHQLPKRQVLKGAYLPKSSMPALESLKDQSATVTFANVYSSLVGHLGLDLNREEQFPIVAQMLKDLYKSQKLIATPDFFTTKDEEYVFLADYVISEFRGPCLTRLMALRTSSKSRMGCSPVLQQVTSSLMQQFWGLWP